MADEFTREQELLKRLRDEQCGGNAAELARRLKKDATYINRLLYPAGKKGRKGIGLELMRAATQAFKLSPGYWEGADTENGRATAGNAQEPTVGRRKGDFVKAMTAEEQALMDEVLEYFRNMRPTDRKAKLKELAELAELGKADRAEWMKEWGLTDIMERAANASRRQIVSTSTDPNDPALRQRPLPGVE